jgi:molybdenum cofactor cytidylyltransferase
MKASILAGLDFVQTAWQPRSQDAWLVAPADLPALSPATTDALLEAFDGNPSTVLAPVHAGRRGHPLLFPWALAPEVRKLEPAGTLRDLLHSHAIHEVACGLRDENDDLDSPADYRRWQDRYKRI